MTSGEQPLFAPHGLPVGPVTFFPALDYGLTYTDNANHGSGVRKTDLLQEYLPSTQIRLLPTELITLNVNYRFGWHDYAKNEARDYLSHDAGMELRLKNLLLENLTWIFAEDYHQTGNASPLEVEALSFTRYETNYASARLEYAKEHLTISGTAYDALRNYFREAFTAADYETRGGNVRGEYRLPDTHMSIYADAGFARTLHEPTSAGDYDTYRFLAGIKGTFRRIEYLAGAGWTHAQFVNRDEQQAGPAAEISVRYNPHRRLELVLFANRRLQPTTTGSLATETDINLTARVVLMDRLRLVAGAIRNESSRSHGPRRVGTEGSLSCEYYLARFASVQGGYAHIERTDTSITPGFRINEARFGFHLAW
ncbi:MAG TPA: outer membrane beta-barrel protein [Planctomycetota bacterium]